MLQAIEGWSRSGKPGGLLRGMAKELDAEGVPRTLPVSDWWDGLRNLADAIAKAPESSHEPIEALAEGWFLAYLRLCRPDGSPAFGPHRAPEDARRILRFWADRLPDPGYETVLDWWFPSKTKGRHAPPPLPADSRPDRPLAVLRSHWLKGGDFLALDHRGASSRSLIELYAGGRPWLGPCWDNLGDPRHAGRARPTLWRTLSVADVAEWTYRVGKAKVTRTVLFLRGRALGLIAEQWEGADDPGGWRIDLPEGVTLNPLEDSRGFSMVGNGARLMPKVLPIGLPGLLHGQEKGLLIQEGRRLTLRQSTEGRRTWRPLLLSWEPSRDRKGIRWRPLTVTEGQKVSGPHEAFAARVTWGRGETLVIYRSLTGPKTRAFLGHQTTARFLVGLFNKEGGIDPLLKVDE